MEVGTESVVVEASDGSAVAESLLTDGGAYEANLADVQASIDRWGTELPMIEEVGEVPYANRGLRPNPEDKLIAQAIKEFGF